MDEDAMTAAIEWARTLKPASLMTDWQIRHAVENFGWPIRKDEGYSPDAIRYCSYEIRAADFIEVAVAENTSLSYLRRGVSGDEIALGPGETIRLFSLENFNLPPYVFSTVIALGQLFSAGITAGSTYIDPGTTGHIYLTVTNVSRCPVFIPVGAPIARAQFFVLGESVERPKTGKWRRLPYRVGRPAERTRSRSSTSKVAANDAARYADVAGESNDSLEAEVVALRKSALFHKVALYVLGALVASLVIPSSFWAFVNGDGMPQFARFLVQAGAGAALTGLVVGDARRTWHRVRALLAPR